MISPRKSGRGKEIKSPYFSHEEDDDDDEVEEFGVGSGSESEEVVKPRGTTRRTRGRG